MSTETVEKVARTNWAYDPMGPDRMYRLGFLDDLIGPDDPVRLFCEILDSIDWEPWNREYAGKHGQPPIRPQLVAAAILFGMVRGVRSSRRLEEACRYRLDFRWLTQGHCPDHATFCQFRLRFANQLKEVFQRINRLAMSIGLIRLGEVAYDGTRIKASNSRYRTYTAEHIEKKLKELDDWFDQAMSQGQKLDEDAEGGSAVRLPAELTTHLKRRAQLRAALERARADEEVRRREGVRTPAQIPMTDPDSRVMPNKEGGYAPNYTPTALTDGERGFVIAADVLNVVNEAGELVAAVDSVEAAYGKVETLMTDSGNSTGANLQALEDRGIEVLAPVKGSCPEAGNPALRVDPQQPVPESEWPNLPRNPQGKLDKSCFVFVPEQDVVYCPLGKPMPYEETKSESRGGERISRRVYRCDSCADCPLKAACVSDKNHSGRTVTRDQFERVRQTVADRMSTPEAKARYNRRPRIAETPFGILKGVMGIRQFLLRGLEKVRLEWLWSVTAFNLAKFMREMARLRAEVAELVTEGV